MECFPHVYMNKSRRMTAMLPKRWANLFHFAELCIVDEISICAVKNAEISRCGDY